MESSGTPPRSDDPGQEPPAGGGAADDLPLPSWYRAPSQPPPADAEPAAGEPAAGEAEPSRWATPSQGAPSEPVEPQQPTGPPPVNPWRQRRRGAPGPQPSSEQPEGAPGAEPAQPQEQEAVAEAPAREPEPAPTAGDTAPLAAASAAGADAEPEPAPTAGDAAPLAAAGAAGAAADEALPPWSRARHSAPAATPAEARADAAEALVPPPPPPPAYPPAAVADAWSTDPDTATAPRWAAIRGRRDQPHVFGDRMAAGVLLTLAAGSMIGGGIAALLIPGNGIDSTIRTVIAGAAAAVLLALSIVLRLVRGTEELRGTLAVTGIAFAAACLVFAYNPDQSDAHATLVKFALAAGLVAVLSWFATLVVPSAVTALLGVVALGIGVGAGVWLAVDQPTPLEVFVADLALGCAVALLLPRIVLLRPHPAGLGWALSGAALVIAFPAIVLMARDDVLTLAAGATASAALLGVAQRHRNLPAGIGAFAGLAYLEALLIATRAGATGDAAPDSTRLIVAAAVGVALLLVVAVAAVLQNRGRTWPPRRRALPVGVTDLLLLAALVLAVVSLFTANTAQPLDPRQLSPTQATTTV